MAPTLRKYLRLATVDNPSALLPLSPANVTSGLGILGWADEDVGLFGDRCHRRALAMPPHPPGRRGCAVERARRNPALPTQP